MRKVTKKNKENKQLETVEVLLCDNISDLHKFCVGQSGKAILCLTKNPEVADYIIQKETKIYVKYLESVKTYCDYAQMTYNVVDKVNAYIDKTVDENKAYLYKLGCSLDMGDSSKKILDALMLQDMLQSILNGFKVKSITCYYYESYASEMEAIYFWKEGKKIPLHIICKNGEEGISRGRLKILIKYGVKIVDVLSKLNAKKFYFDTWKKSAGKKRKVQESVNYDIGIVQHGAKQKNYNWTIGYLRELEKAGISFQLIGINGEIADKWEKWGVPADSPLKYIDKSAVRRGYCEYKKQKTRVKRVFNREAKGILDGILNAEHLRMILKSHFDYGVFNAVVMDIGADIFFKYHSYRMIDYSVNTNYISAKVCYFNVKKYNQTTKFKSSSGGLSILPKENTYEPYDFISDFSFVLEKKEQKSTGRKYILKNTTYTDEFYNNKLVKKNLKEGLQVLWAPSYPALGVTHYSSFEKTGMSILEFFSEKTGKLLVKFHPNQMEQEIRRYYQKYGECANIKFCKNNENIRSVMDMADIVVTNCSLSIIDAAVKKKAVICVVDKTEYELVKQHKEGIIIVTDTGELVQILRKLCDNNEFRKQWIVSCVKKQNQYFEKYIAKQDTREEAIRIIRKEMES